LTVPPEKFFITSLLSTFMKIVAIGAHPDDPEIGCGGSLLLHADAGDAVTLVYATDGAAGSASIPKERLIRMRRTEAERSGAVLGADSVRFLSYCDGHLAYAGYDLVADIGRIIRSEKPDTVYTHSVLDAHPDHSALASATIEACRRAATPYFQELGQGRHTVGEIRLFEVWTPLQDFRVAVDITPVIDRKVEAIRQHASQLAATPYDEIARGLNRYRSIALRGSTYAEVFDTVRSTW
jgi:LmbE family N-acetylglucosaminyl deacetylase